MQDDKSSKRVFEVLTYGGFRSFLLYRSFLTMATLMQAVLIGWQVYALTKNVFLLGLVGLIEVIPQVSISLFAGHFIDLWDRKRIIIYTTLLLLVGSAILFLYSVPSLNCFERFGVFPVFVTIFLTGLVRGVLMPAHQAIIGQLVPRNLLPNAATLNSTNWQVAAVLGPAIGGLVYGFWGVMPAYALVFALFFAAFIAINFVTVYQNQVFTISREGVFERIKQGIDFVFKQPILLGAFSLDMFAVLFGGAVAMLPVFASDILHVGPQGLGFLRACPAVGAITMSIILAFNQPVNRSGQYLLMAVAGFGICIIGFALSTSVWMAAVFLVLSGACDNISVVIRGSILQLFTPDSMRGRVSSVNSIFIGSSNELGAFESGVAARYLGLVPSVVFGGAMTLLVVLVALKKAPTLRRLSIKDHLQKKI